jgi:drug/metabolite transporter (DMT)-like permease
MTGIPKTRLLSYLALGVGVIALSMSGIFTRWSQAPGIVTVSMRMLLASLVLTPLAVRARIHARIRAGAQAETRIPFMSKKVLLLGLLGGFCMALDIGTWSTAVTMTRIANATLLNNIAPLWVVLFAVAFWGERPKGWFWVGLGLTMSGAVIVLGDNIFSNPQLTAGDLLGLVSSLFWASYFLATSVGRRHMDALTYIWMVTLSGGLMIFALVGILGLPVVGYPLSTYLAIMGAAFFTQICGHFLLTYALGHLPAAVVSPTMILAPVMTSLLAIPLANEPLNLWQTLGGMAVLGGILLVNLMGGAKK